MKKINLLHLGGNGGVPKIWKKSEIFNIISSDGIWQKKNLVFCQNLDSKKETLFFSSCSKKRKFFIYKDKYLSSFHAPSHIKNNRYTEKDFKIIKTLNVRPTTIDEFSKNRQISIHALDIDCQGHTLPILKGAKNSLDTILLIKCEVDFIELYKDQSHAGDILNFLSDNGFNLVRTYNCGSKKFPYSYDTPKFSKKRKNGLIAWMDCVFLKNPAKINNKDGFQKEAYKKICYFIGTPSLIRT